MTNLRRCHLMLEMLFPDQPRLQQRWWSNINRRWGITPQEMFDKDPEIVLKYLLNRLGE